MAANRSLGLEVAAQRFGGVVGILGFQPSVQLGGNDQELAVPGLPDSEKRAGVRTAFDGPALVEAGFESLAHLILLQTLPAGVLENAGQPEEFLTV